ncbi:MAG: hypothetical protein IJ530_08780 [Treponema sp.]|uniref:hypothetical protein n=1 Tax=Treponema sp. TaxID=166 RepID=UPI0025CEFC91|nr:hypothetical protein [Treponema sp.]MBQ8679847.1 hypothetical protein [Treponema sp.]
MRKKQLEKVREEFERIDLSRYHILTYDELLKVNGGSGNDSDDSDDEAVGSESEETSNEGVETATESTPSDGGTSASNSGDTEESGGHEIENTVEAVANAEVGDTLTRDDGTQVTITQGDIDWAQEHCPNNGKEGEVTEVTNPSVLAENDEADAVEDENSPASSNTTEEKTEQGTASSAKESEHTAGTGTVQSESNKTSSNESSQPISSGHSEKSGHSFFDGIVGWFDEKINTAKDWLSDFFGIGEASKVTENAVISSENPKETKSAWEKISETIKSNKDDKNYNKPAGYKCDNWAEEIINKAGFKSSDYFKDGTAANRTCAQHIDYLKENCKEGVDYTTKLPDSITNGAYVVFMGGENPKGGQKLQEHCGILMVKDGAYTFWHNSSSNGTPSYRTNVDGTHVLDSNGNSIIDYYSGSVKGENVWERPGGGVQGLLYTDFYYQEIK